MTLVYRNNRAARTRFIRQKLQQRCQRRERLPVGWAAPKPGPDLMNQVRAGFLLQNTTLAEWCRTQRINASAARQAVYGTWNGAKGQAMRAKVLKAAGLQPEPAAAKRGKAAA